MVDKSHSYDLPLVNQGNHADRVARSIVQGGGGTWPFQYP